MTRLKKSIFLIVLSILSSFLMLVGLFSIKNVSADNDRLRILSENKGFIQSKINNINADTSLSISFDLIYNLNSGDSYVGFGICETNNVNDIFMDETNVDSGYAVLFDDKTSILGGGANYNINYTCSKSQLLKENYKYKATFNNKNGTFILEKKAFGPNSYTIVQKVENIAILNDGEYSIGFMYSENFDVVIENISFSVDENETLDLGKYSTEYTNENGSKVSNIVEVQAQDGNDGVAYTEINSNGISCFANENIMNASSNGKIVISFTTSLFDLYDNSEIGFAIGTKEKDGVIFTGEKGISFALDKNQGIKKYTKGDFSKSEIIESNLNVHSIFSSNRAVKAVFDVNEGVFQLLVRFYEGSEFIEVGRVTNLNLYKENFYVGLQFNGKANLKLVGVSIFNSRELLDYATLAEPLHSEKRNLSVKDNVDGTTTFKLTQTTDNSGRANEVLFTENPVSVNDDESIIVYIKDISFFEMQNPGYQAKASFIFSNTLKNPVQYMYSYNTNFTMFYENGRSVYWLKDEENKSVTTESLGSTIKFDDLFSVGNSVMAVFNPAYQSYSLYVKSALNPEFSLVQSFSIPKTNTFKINKIFYVGFELYYGMEMTVADYGVYKAKTNEVGVTPSENTSTFGNGSSNNGGFTIKSNGASYVSFSDIDISDCDSVAIEYGIEEISNADGSYLLGFMITDGNKLPDKPFIKNRKDNTQFMEEPGKYIEGTKSVLYAFVPPVGLTNDINGKIRDYIFHSGYKIRAVFSFKDRTTTIQYKSQTGNSWNNVTVYDDLPEYLNSDKITVALRLQNTVKMSLNSLRAYKLNNENISYEYISDTAEDVGNAVMRNIKVQSEDKTKGYVYINEEGIEEVNVLDGTLVDINAVSSLDYIFTGWYLEGKLVSKESIYTVEIDKTAIYEAKFAPSSRIVIKNGYEKYQTEIDKLYEEEKFVGINPQKVYGYEFVGWEISSYQVNSTEKLLLDKYFLGKNYVSNNNMLENYKDNLKIWKTLKNNFVVDNNCLVEKDESGCSYLKFGKYTIIDKQGYNNGALIIKIPKLENKYDGEELVVENYIEVEAKYQKKDIIESGSFETDYGENYRNNLKKTQKWFIIIAVITVVLVIALVVLKIYLTNRVDRRK